MEPIVSDTSTVTLGESGQMNYLLLAGNPGYRRIEQSALAVVTSASLPADIV